MHNRVSFALGFLWGSIYGSLAILALQRYAS